MGLVRAACSGRQGSQENESILRRYSTAIDSDYSIAVISCISRRVLLHELLGGREGYYHLATKPFRLVCAN